MCETPTSLEALIDLAICVDSRRTVMSAELHADRRTLSRTAAPPANSTAILPIPSCTPNAWSSGHLKACTRTHADWPHLSDSTGAQQTLQGATLPVLQGAGPPSFQLPGKTGAVLTGATLNATLSTSCSTIPAVLSYGETRLTAPVLLVSGVDASFICPSLVRHLGLTTSPLQQPHCTNALTGAHLGEVDTITAPAKLQFSGNHQEEPGLKVMKSPQVPVVLGPGSCTTTPKWIGPWGTITGWSPSCHASCLLSASGLQPPLPPSRRFLQTCQPCPLNITT